MTVKLCLSGNLLMILTRCLTLKEKYTHHWTAARISRICGAFYQPAPASQFVLFNSDIQNAMPDSNTLQEGTGVCWEQN